MEIKGAPVVISEKGQPVVVTGYMDTTGTFVPGLPSGGGGDVDLTPYRTSAEQDVIDAAQDEAIASKVSLVRGEVTKVEATTINATATEVLTATITDAGNCRFFLSGLVTRVGGSSGIGTLNISLLNGSTVITSGTFEVFRDTNTIKQIFTPKTFDIPAGTTLSLQASYTPASTETISISNVNCGYDNILL